MGTVKLCVSLDRRALLCASRRWSAIVIFLTLVRYVERNAKYAALVKKVGPRPLNPRLVDQLAAAKFIGLPLALTG